MPEIREDPVTGNRVIISTERGGRPCDYTEIEQASEGFCPFCPGNEEHTTKPRLSVEENGKWKARVLPNKYPVLTNTQEKSPASVGFFKKMPGLGEHEIIVESDEHSFNFYHATPKDFDRIFTIIHERSRALSNYPNVEYILYFKNYKHAAGATLSHPHSQIIATPIVPSLVREEFNGSSSFYQKNDGCVFCKIIEEEIKERERIVYENENFIVLCPFASRTPFETWLLPKTHQSDFRKFDITLLEKLSDAANSLFKRAYKTLDDIAFNFLLHTSAVGKTSDNCDNYYHWHFEFIPKMNKLAGFEWGSGFYINSVAPEKAAFLLREAR